MAIEIKTIACPQCGSTDVQMTCRSEGRGAAAAALSSLSGREPTRKTCITRCMYTQTAILLKKRFLPQNGDLSGVFKDQFIRKAWITLAAENAPIEVFNETFRAAVKPIFRFSLIRFPLMLHYQASVGYDREEPYTDYEHIMSKSRISRTKSSGTTSRSKRKKDKLPNIKGSKQRPVTKYKTVTDWSATGGSHHTYSVAVRDAETELT
ncbi:MAG: hypothetical protein ACLUN6_03910 [Holdemanella sp.]|uniref:hypothetical protein n=1 Tax=Holdemanella sp. TaxID=1971762 RepID=UPI003993020A